MREIVYHDRTDTRTLKSVRHSAIGEWSRRNLEGHRTFIRMDGKPNLYLFNDEVDSDDPYLTPEQSLSALEQVIQEVCDEDTQNRISDRYREIIERGDSSQGTHTNTDGRVYTDDGIRVPTGS